MDNSDEDREPTIDSRDLLVQYRIEPHDYCPLSQNEDFDVREIRTQATAEGSICEMLLYAPQVRDGRALVTHCRTDRTCPCSIFAEYDSIPVVKAVDNGELLIEAYLDDRNTLDSMTEDLRKASASVSLELVKTNDAGRLSNQLVSIDLGPLTDKQLEALQLAVTSGYYDTDREVTFTDLAGQLGISSQAFSQRLAAAEEKVMEQLFQLRRPPGDDTEPGA